MDAMTFIERMASHAIWPLAVLVLILLFRAEIRQRIVRLQSFKAGPGGLEAGFASEQVAEAISNASEAMKGRTAPGTPEIQEDRERLERMARISPRAAVLESFRILDLALKQHLTEVGVPGAHEQMRSTPAILLAQQHGLVGPSEVAVWNDLRDVANTARQIEVPIATDKAVDYVQVSSNLRAKIEDSTPSPVI
ncbi:hypothetical protein J5X84_40650 [Streptosporangiaceae bacterium NEAU-GS5]|nr:hypothetical protein [Streptosporangiaceae bacterium NEAU-GS5]